MRQKGLVGAISPPENPPMPNAPSQAQPIQAAFAMLRAPDGRILMLRRAATEDYGGTWAFPGGKLKEGESPERACWREVFEEIGYRIGGIPAPHMRRIKDGVDATTYLIDVDSAFVPQLNSEHSDFAWLKPKDVVAHVVRGGPDPTAPAPAQVPDPDEEFLAELERPF
jgi:8-oxo-dGTP diphosphatase